MLQGLYISKETCGSVNLYDPTRHSKELGGNIIRAVVAPYPPWVLQRNSSTGIFGFDGILLELKCVVLLARGCVVVIGCSGVCRTAILCRYGGVWRAELRFLAERSELVRSPCAAESAPGLGHGTVFAEVQQPLGQSSSLVPVYWFLPGRWLGIKIGILRIRSTNMALAAQAATPHACTMSQLETSIFALQTCGSRRIAIDWLGSCQLSGHLAV